MGEYTDVGGVADIFVEYHGEEDSENSSSGSDFEMDEMVNLSDADEPAIVISAERAACSDDDVQFVQEVLVPHDSAHASGQGTQTPSQAQPGDSDSESDSDLKILPHEDRVLGVI
ncbi:hypothetical protein ZWY2020_041214 [Hordeum vulgare]|nr:hypothetical protein ZWY2020_041214 [Hordeum vulgare]